MQLSKNFTQKEFNSKDGASMPDEVLRNIQLLSEQLQIIRDYTGKSITINSGKFLFSFIILCHSLHLF